MATDELQMYYKVLDDLQDVTTEKGLVSHRHSGQPITWKEKSVIKTVVVEQ